MLGSQQMGGIMRHSVPFSTSLYFETRDPTSIYVTSLMKAIIYTLRNQLVKLLLFGAEHQSDNTAITGSKLKMY
jgi:hypothetical protein